MDWHRDDRMGRPNAGANTIYNTYSDTNAYSYANQ
jgi:hypothetical protein